VPKIPASHEARNLAFDKEIGERLRTVQFGWPVGMPLVRKLDSDLWEVRIHLENTIARVFFTTEQNVMLLLHGIIKKGQKTPAKDLKLTRKRLRQVKETRLK